MSDHCQPPLRRQGLTGIERVPYVSPHRRMAGAHPRDAAHAISLQAIIHLDGKPSSPPDGSTANDVTRTDTADQWKQLASLSSFSLPHILFLPSENLEDFLTAALIIGRYGRSSPAAERPEQVRDFWCGKNDAVSSIAAFAPVPGAGTSLKCFTGRYP
ncbi:MAG: hypothetical protein GX591_03450 [Planctomycetes bacterium]|nr:hypothetical protein [Planctomycetota bacterium]